MAWSLAVASAASFAAGALFLRIGVRLGRHVAGPEGQPLRAFGMWWAGIGAATVCYGLRILFGAAGWKGPVVVMLGLGIAFAGLAVWGLIAYLSYLYTGRRNGGRVAAWVYGVLVAFTLGYIAAAAPHRLVVQRWTVDAYAVTAPLGASMDVVLTLAFLLPPLAAAVLILHLLGRTQDRDQRRRILAVGLGLPLWVSAHLAARLSDADLWQFFARVVLGVGVALAISVAYGVGPRPRRPHSRDFQDRVDALV